MASLNIMWTRVTGPAPTKAAGAPVSAATLSSFPTATPFSARAGSSFGPSPTPPAISRVLAGTLPRQVRYADVVLTISRAEITNRDPEATDPARQYRADKAYAILDTTFNNTGTSSSVWFDSVAMRLQLADGKSYEPTTPGFRYRYQPQASEQTSLIFIVPLTATLQGAQFHLKDPNKEPALLPLDGVAPTSPYPITIKEPGQAAVGQTIYKVTSASLDLDWHGTRADLGKRFMNFALHFTNNSGSYTTIGGNSFRLLVDGEPLAPRDLSYGGVISAMSAMDLQFAFLVPANFGKVELQVGSVGGATAKIPIALKAP